MTDPSNTQPTSKVASGGQKAGVTGLYFMICQNVTPAIVAYLCAHLPLLSETTWFQIVTGLEGSLVTVYIWLNWKNLIEFISDGIIGWREAKQRLKDAFQRPLK